MRRFWPVYGGYAPYEYSYAPDYYGPEFPEQQPAGAPVVVENDIPVSVNVPANPYAPIPLCKRPRIIEIGKPKTHARLPRVIYGMPLYCIDARAAPGPGVYPVD